MLPLSRFRFRRCDNCILLLGTLPIRVGLAEGSLIRMCLGKSDDRNRRRYYRYRRWDLE